MKNNMLSESKYMMGYSRWVANAERYETWSESVDRVFSMHEKMYADKLANNTELQELFAYAKDAYKDKLILGAQRALQFGGEQIFAHQARMYNCSVSFVDRPAFFNECMYLMLCGCGVGFSVLQKNIDKLPPIARRSQTKAEIFVVHDCI